MKCSRRKDDVRTDGAGLPNALIIGVQKSATTWLSVRLSQHPDVFMVPGEVHYFDNFYNYSRGLSWYSERFAGSQGYKVRCEKTPDYFWTSSLNVPQEPADKPKKIFNLLSEAKLLLILRNPVDRAISAWNHHVRAGRIHPSTSIDELFSAKLAEFVHRSGILTRGLYHAQLMDYMRYFDRNQLLILFFETDIIQHPKETLKRVSEYLGINQDFQFQDVGMAENVNQPTNLGLLGVHLTKGGIHRGVSFLDRKILTYLPLRKWQPSRPNTETRNRLYEYYQKDCEALQGVIGNLPTSWRNDHSLVTQ